MRHTAHYVDELTRRHEVPVGKFVPVASVEPNPSQPRADLGELGGLVESIRERGILEPILVRKLLPEESTSMESLPRGAASSTGVRYRIIAGERRYRAALEAGLFEIPVVEMDLSELEAFEVALVENLQRKDLSPFEEAEGYRALRDRHDYSQEQIAHAVGKSRSSVAETLTLLAIPPEIRTEAQKAGLEARSALLEIARAGNPDAMRRLIDKACREGLTRDDLRKETRRSRQGASRTTRPFVFRFRSPDRSFKLEIAFRRKSVVREDLITALEQILSDLRKQPETPVLTEEGP